MDRGTALFWAFVLLLSGASGYFTLQIESQRRASQQAEASLENGDIVEFVRTLDGDTLVVRKEDQKTATVRLIGIKTFESKTEKDAAATFGRSAEEFLATHLRNQPVRVLLNTPPKDRHGRTLATLYVDDRDVAQDMVRRGLALVYTVYPFPAMARYVEAQQAARSERTGLWSHSEVTQQADALIAQWRRKAP